MHAFPPSTPASARLCRLGFHFIGSLGLALSLAVTMPCAEAQQYSWSTVAGAAGLAGSADTPGFFNQPYHLARDSDGNVYATDYASHTVRKITPSGVVSTFAGTAGLAGSTDATGAAARFNGPGTITVDGSGTLFVCDFNSHTIRQVTAAGVVTTLAGTAGAAGSADGVGAAARFNSPQGLALDGLGNLYVADALNHTIRKIVIATATVSTFAGQAGSAGSADGTGAAARFNAPIALVLDGGGNLVVSELFNSTLRRVTTFGTVVTTIAGVAGSPGTTDGVGSAARLNAPYDLVLDGTSNTIFFAEIGSHTVRRMTADGTVSTLCGLAGVSGYANGTGSNARFNQPAGIVLDGTSNTLLVSEVGNQTIRRVSLDGVCTTWVGTPGVAGSANTAGVFGAPFGIARDLAGNLYVSDVNARIIRKITPAGVVSLYAGQLNVPGTADGTGTAAQFGFPRGMDCDSAGNLYVADYDGATIRKIAPGGVVTTLAGQPGVGGGTDGTGNAARFNLPVDVKVDGAGNLFVADRAAVRKVTAAGVVTTLAGLFGSTGSVDGTGNAARFNSNAALAVDAAGNVYVADLGNRNIRKVTPAGVVTTLAGLAGAASSVIDGTGSAARFAGPAGMGLDGAGNLIVSENLHVLRKVTPAGVVTTLAGVPGFPSQHIDGVGSAARLSDPRGIVRDPLGNLFVACSGDTTIRKVTPGGAVTTFAGTPGLAGTTNTGGNFNQPDGVALDSNGDLFVCDATNHTIRKITPAGVISTFAGLAGNPGNVDSTGSAARFVFPHAIAVDGSNNLYVADTISSTIRKITPGGVVSTLAGTAFASGYVDATGAAARFSNSVVSIAAQADGTVYVADRGNHRIRKITPAGVVTTLAGSGAAAEVDGTGTGASFNEPSAICVDAAGFVYVGTYSGRTLRKITPASVVTTLAGLGNTFGTVDGTGAAARFGGLTGAVVDGLGNIFLSDGGINVIRKVTATGVVTTIGGLAGNSSGSADGLGAAARFSTPGGIALDAAGNLYVGEIGTHLIRKGTRVGARARLVQPALGAALPAPTTVFAWEAGIGATNYALWIGSVPGGYDLYAGLEGTNLFKTVSLPPDLKVYVTLWSYISGAWQSNSYAFEPAPSQKAVVISPTQGSTLTSSTLSLQWSAATGASQYAIWVGNSYGAYDLGAGAYSTDANSATFTGIPTDGGPVYVTLWSFINGTWQRSDHWYFAQTGAGNRPATMTVTTPGNNGSTIPSGTVIFGWLTDPGVGATSYAIWIGSTPGGYDIYSALTGTGTYVIPTNIPGDGRRIYVTLWSLIGGAYLSNSYWFTCPNNAAPSAINTPVSGSTLGTTQAFNWNGNALATNYALWIGSTPGGYDLYAGNEGLNTARTATGLPADGRVIHATLWSLISGTYQSSASWFYAAPDPQSVAGIRLTSHSSGQFLTDATTTFTWGGGGGYNSNHYPLWIGSTPGAADLYNAVETTNSHTITLPTDGRKLYATLWCLIGGVYKSNSYLLYAASIPAVRAALTSPAFGSTLTGSTATLNWTTGQGVTSYYLFIGSAPGGYDLGAINKGTATTHNLTGLPTDGRPIHITLWSLINGVYQASASVVNAWQTP